MMQDSMFEAMKREKDLILSCTYEEYVKSPLNKTHFLYGDYVRYEAAFYTIKEHPSIDIGVKHLHLPKIHKASELFEFCYIVNDGVGNKNAAPRKPQTVFINDMQTKDKPLDIICASTPKRDKKHWKHVYVKVREEIAKEYHCESFAMFDRYNCVTDKNEWLIIMYNLNGIAHNWMAVINEWDLQSIDEII